MREVCEQNIWTSTTLYCLQLGLFQVTSVGSCSGCDKLANKDEGTSILLSGSCFAGLLISKFPLGSRTRVGKKERKH